MTQVDVGGHQDAQIALDLRSGQSAPAYLERLFILADLTEVVGQVRANPPESAAISQGRGQTLAGPELREHSTELAERE